MSTDSAFEKAITGNSRSAKKNQQKGFYQQSTQKRLLNILSIFLLKLKVAFFKRKPEKQIENQNWSFEVSQRIRF